MNMYKVYFQVMNIIVKYHHLHFTYINFFNKTTLIFILLFFISFFLIVDNILISFDQFFTHLYFISKYPLIYPYNQSIDTSEIINIFILTDNPTLGSLACKGINKIYT